MAAKRVGGTDTSARSFAAWTGLYVLTIVITYLFWNRSTVDLFWPAAGVGAAWAVTRPSLRQAGIAAGMILAVCVLLSSAFGNDPGAIVAFGVGHAVMALGTRALLDLHRGSTEGAAVTLGATRDLLFVSGACVLAAVLTSPFGAVAAYLASGAFDGADLATWSMRNASSAIVFVAVLLEVRRLRDASLESGTNPWHSLRARGPVEELALVAGVAVFALAYFASPDEVPVSFAAVGLAAWVGLRMGPTITALFCALIGFVVSIATNLDHGEFAHVADPLLKPSLVQLFVALTMLVAMVLALSVRERDDVIARLRHSEMRATFDLQFREAISQHIVETLLVIDSDDQVLYANVAPEHYADLGRTLTTGLFDTRGDAVPRESMPHRRALADEGVTEQRLVSDQGGHRQVLSFTATKLVGFQDLAVPAAVVVVRDVTAEQQVNDSLREFVGVVAHDLKTPLSLVTSWAAFAKEYVEESGVMSDPGHVTGMLERIERGGGRMADLIDDLLNHALASGSQLEIEQVDLGELIREVVRDTALDDAVVVGTLPSVPGDRRLLRQVCENIIGNAVKYVQPGVTACVTIGSRYESATRVAITFDDNGIGVPPEDLESIFSPFKRLNHDYPGTGLGLAICRSIVDRHDGRLVAEPRVGGGTTFTMTLPVAQDASAGRGDVVRGEAVGLEPVAS